MSTKAPMRRADWRKTPYAQTEAQDPDAAMRHLLARYKATDFQFTETTGENGRRAFILRFKLAGKAYRIGTEVLHAGAKPEAYCRWLFGLLGLRPGDVLDDLFPGTGAVGRAWDTWATEQRAHT